MEVCEICGRKTSKPYAVFIEGARVVVCESCAKRYKNAEPLYALEKRVKRVARRPQKRLEERTFEIVDDFGKIIRKEREKRGLKIEELAKAIAEPESEIRKIEREELTPDLKVARKLEKFLGVQLVMEITEEELENKQVTGEKERLTLGDIVVVKRKKSNQ